MNYLTFFCTLQASQACTLANVLCSSQTFQSECGGADRGSMGCPHLDDEGWALSWWKLLLFELRITLTA